MKKINELVVLRPWAMKQDTFMAMTQIVERHLKGEKLSQEEINARIGGEKAEPPILDIFGDVARIPVYGIIAKRANMVGGISQPRGTSTEQIQKDFLAALQEPRVKTLLLDIDSPGGSVGGISELSDLIFQSRGSKRILAFANGQMDSAAYWLGSAADEIYASKSSELGSIGVYTVLSDYSVLYHNEGIKKEIIKAGKFKATGDPSRPLTEDERAQIQEEIDAYYDLFVEAIARNRNMTRDSVIKLADGRVFIGQKAVDAGLADGIRTFEQLLSASPGSVKPKASASSMSVQIDQPNAIQANKEEKDMDLTIEKLKAEHKPLADALVAEGKASGIEEGKVAGLAEGKQSGAKETEKSERARCAAIVSAMPQGAMAICVQAINDGLTVDAAKAKFLDAINAGTIKPLGQSVDTEEAGPAKIAKTENDPDGSKHLEAAKKYAKENKCGLMEALKATAQERNRN